MQVLKLDYENTVLSTQTFGQSNSSLVLTFLGEALFWKVYSGLVCKNMREPVLGSDSGTRLETKRSWILVLLEAQSQLGDPGLVTLSQP